MNMLRTNKFNQKFLFELFEYILEYNTTLFYKKIASEFLSCLFKLSQELNIPALTNISDVTDSNRNKSEAFKIALSIFVIMTLHTQQVYM